MICPKCGFEQPDEIYCAFCGVNVERYARQKRKRRYRLFVIVFLVGVAGLVVARHMKSTQDADQAELAGKYGAEDTRPSEQPGVSPETWTYQDPADIRYKTPDTTKKVEPRRPEDSFSPGVREDDRFGFPESTAQSPAIQERAEDRQELAEKTYTATDWFEKGRAMDDESESEVECYRNAIELDPKFAPAHFRLGAIYYRQANYELADQAFGQFLEHASEADRETFNIYVYYSPSDVERLTAPEIETPAETEDIEKESTTEAGEEEKALSDGGEEEAQESLSATEAETEGAAGEEELEETGEEVMTIVRFLPYDGHIMVPVTLNGVLEAHVIVDTGSGITVLSRDMAGRLGLEGESGQAITLRTMATNIEAELVRLDSIQVGDLVQNNLPVAITALPSTAKGDFDGILGMDFMNQYKIHIDNDNQRIVFSPGKRSWQ